MRTKTVWPLVLVLLLAAVVAVRPQEAPKRAQIWSPSAGGVLFLNEVIEVALEGLSAQAAASLVVNVLSHPIGRERERSPISRCRGSAFVPVVQSQLMLSDMCAVVTWTDPERGRATLRVRWNYRAEGFVEGDHMVRIELFIRYDDRVHGRWAETPWYPLRLIAREGVQTRQAELVSPQPDSRFRLGEIVRVQGKAVNATLPIRVQLQILRAVERDGWHTVDEESFDDDTFVLAWDTSHPLAGHALQPGRYSLRAAVLDAEGYSATSDELSVDLVRKPPTLQILIGGEAVPVAKVRERDLVQFGVREDGQWASFQWDFGDGTRSHERWPLHAYVKPGTFEACLTAWPEPEFKGPPVRTCVKVLVSERPVVLVRREIYGFPVPGRDEMSVLPGTPAYVRLQVRVLGSAVGLSITENAPTGWRIEDRTQLGDPRLECLTLPGVDGHRMTWVVTSREPALSADMEFSIAYTLSPPVGAKLGSAGISGVVYVQVGAGREMTAPVPGRSELTVLASLPIGVALAYLERGGLDNELRLKAPGMNDTYLLTEAQMEIARGLIGREVPFTARAIMTPKIYLQLRAFYEAKEPVTAWPKD